MKEMDAFTQMKGGKTILCTYLFMFYNAEQGHTKMTAKEMFL